MSPQKQLICLIIGILLYLACASCDIFFTLQGVQGDATLEGNPAMRWTMENFGLFPGLVLQKILILMLVLLIVKWAKDGIERDADWVYYLALTKFTRMWMKKKKRYGVAFLPLYLVSLAQGFAAASWWYLFL